MFKRVSKKLSMLFAVLLIVASILSSFTPTSVNADGVFAYDLFFSEYVEGSSNNKAIEIFNGTDVNIDLSQYTVELYSNGAATANYTLSLSGELASGDVYVIVNSSASDALKAYEDLEHSVTNFNGDDALVLKNNGVIIDCFGKVGFDPGTYWGTTDCNALDHTLVRKSNVIGGDTIANDDFNPSDEWDCYPKDTFDYLGSHTMDGFGGGTIVEKVAAVTADPAPGAVDTGTEVSLSTETADAEIFYKSVYSDEYTEYTTPIDINEDTTIWAVARKDGMADSDEAVFEYTIKSAEEEKSIADVRAAEVGSIEEVTGVVTWVGDTTKVYIQDATAAIVVDLYYIPGTKPSLQIGDEITATGALVRYNGLLTIKLTTADNVLKVSENNELPEPKLITIPEANSGNYEAQLVRLEDLTLGTVATGGSTPVTDSGSNTINIYKIALPAGIVEGDIINTIAIVSRYNSTFQLRIRSAEDVTEVLPPDTESPVIVHTPVTEGNTGLNLNISAVVTDNRDVTGVKLYYRTSGETTYKTIDMVLDNGEYSCDIPKAELSKTGLEYYIEASDGTNTATLPADTSIPYAVNISEADITSPEIANQRPADGAYTGSDCKPTIGADYSDESVIDTASVKLYLDGQEVTAQCNISELGVTYVPAQDLIEGEHTVHLIVKDKAAIPNETDISWKFNVGVQEFNLYFGQLHSHTTNSDGLGSLDDAYSYARDTANVDFLAVTDHSNSFDNGTTSSMGDGLNSTKWNNGHIAADSYTNSNFVGIYAYEMTWSNGTGHMNTFNTPGFETRENAVYKAADGLKQYYNVLKNFPESISQFNHPGTTFGDFLDFANYDSQIDNLISLIEVGNGEGAVGSSNYFPSYEYYTRALDKGWHVSPTNNQDNHKGGWGDANTARTVILADSLTRDGVYDAIRNMRTYATEDENLRIEYTLNGEMMGTILQQEPDSVNIKVDIEDPDDEAIGEVSVIVDGGKVVDSKTLTASADTVEFTLDPDYSYYYIRIDEEDNDIAVTAPIWIGEVDKAGISKTTASTTLPVKGENLIITTNLFNNENHTMNIQSLTYSIDGNVIDETTAIDPINSLSTGAYNFTYAPDSSGRFNIDVKLVATIDGVEKIFTDVLKLDVTDPVLVTKVVADGAHFNDYVNGYYANNLGNFTAIANKEKITVNIEKTKLTDDLLNDVKLLIISAPAKKAGTANGVSYQPQSFSDDDIAVVKSFVDNGGNLLVCGIADYQDGTGDYQTSTQMNKLLEGIGATSRFNNDEVIDNTQKLNNQNFRLAFDDYNMDSPYLEGVDLSQIYSFYSGCSISLDEEALDSGKTTWLVKGHDTTESIDSNNKLPGVALPKGSVYALAVEQLDGGGKMFIGGTVYISDFEVKAQLDNASQLQNSNYNITMNILDSIKEELPVSPISEVRSAQKGAVHCAEGTVTAGKSVADNAFFDTIYIQDATGGINIFPVSDTDITVGQKVKVIGSVDEYQGDIELRVIELSVTDTSIDTVAPTALSTKEAMETENGGLLVKIEGNVISMDSQNLYIDDGSGEARAFVDGYIGDGSGDVSKAGKWDPLIMVGDKVSIIGLASVDTEGPRLRVRNTNEIVRIKDTVPPIITIAGVSNGGFYNTNVSPIVTANEGIITMSLNSTGYYGEAITQEGSYTLEVTAVDRDNNAAMQTISFVIDKTLPIITSNIRNGDALERINTINVVNTAVDAGSGIVSVESILDDKIIENNGIINIETLSFGVHHMVITAKDKAGNTAVLKIDFTITATISTLEKLVIEFYNEGAFKNKGMYTSLMSKVVKGNLKPFINYLEAQSGKGISIETANILKEYADWISQNK